MDMTVTERYLILSKEEVAAALDASTSRCSTGPGDSLDSLTMAIAMGLTRLEQVLEIGTLARRNHHEYFDIYDSSLVSSMGEVEIRTVNAFISKDVDVEVFNQYGKKVNVTHIDYTYGIVRCSQLQRGRYTIKYTAGFDFDPTTLVLKDVPQALKVIAIDCILVWRRLGVLQPTAGKGVSYTMLVRAAIRELFTLGKGTYDRPRTQALIWSDPV